MRIDSGKKSSEIWSLPFCCVIHHLHLERNHLMKILVIKLKLRGIRSNKSVNKYFYSEKKFIIFFHFNHVGSNRERTVED